jgi:hypothetical protein
MSINHDEDCDSCYQIEDALVSCPETFTPNSPVWLGYGLDRYGLSAYGSPTVVLPVVKRDYFTLLSGYHVKHQNDRKSPYEFGDKLYVYSSTENKAYKANKCTVGYPIHIESLKIADLTASIDTKRLTEDLTASIFVLSPAFEYGKTLTLVLNASDYAGNALPEFILVFTIEERD